MIDLDDRNRVRRLNRRLALQGQRLTVSRSTRSLARYIVYDTHTGNPDAWADDLEGWEREEGLR